ncbi:hypothetical protein K2173_012059 [Erythroxylum novogranatense]|uniref:Phosphatidylinositol 4-phosphate 5-kinase n=1 Tax=Erythroxylum novogranatense TaxID=1862640 RepID=A0AAV8TEZ7_9ROSI|nr:hypothetical protein K2173_012059 [Erythroxylum novogranatense]
MQETVLTLSQQSSSTAIVKQSLDTGVQLFIPPPCHLVTNQPKFQRGVNDTEDVDGSVVEEKVQVLGNGDMYMGSCSLSHQHQGLVVPHGKGKYLWSDGSMYEGEWKLGRASGFGKFSWPSGATYEGHFRSGCMDGFGTFIGFDGDSYKGNWLSDHKHGFGLKRYANGDVYQGSWKSNLQDGQGKYIWSNGNVYAGEWNKGVIHGNGVLVWTNGNRYEGYWENGVPKGKGFFTFSNSNPHRNNHREFSNCLKNREEVVIAAARQRQSVDSKFPTRICIWELDGEAGDITCDIVHNNEPSNLLFRDGVTDNKDSGGSECATTAQRSSCGSADGDVKRPGQTISKGHKNYDLMLNLQLGIRYSVGKHSSIMRDLKQSDFDPSEKFWTRFPPEGSKSTPPHQSVDFRWKDYCPVVFRHLRELFAVDPADYMLAICGSDALREFSSPGKSGSFFYLTQDDRFIIKTVKKSEVKVLLGMLSSYYRHVCQYNNSLVTKFFGVHCVKPVGGQKTRFIVMGNLFCSEYRIHKRYDLKGSSYGRTLDKADGQRDETTTLKDLDLDFVFHLERSWFQELMWQICKDCEFLEAEKIMDYSLLIGVHFRDDYSGEEAKMSPKNINSEEGNVNHDETFMRGYHLLPDMDWVMEDQGPFIRLGVNMPARAERVGKGRSEMEHQNQDWRLRGESNRGNEVILYFGIIDILQDYDITKKIEHAYKSLQVDPTSISAVDPKLYSKRFRDFIHKIFVEDKVL